MRRLCYACASVSSAQRFLALFVLLCILAAVLRTLTRRGPVPYAVLLAVAGIGVGALPGLPHTGISADLILLVFVPGLVFEATMTLDLAALRRRLLSVGLLATVGVAATVLLIGLLTHVWLGLSWTSGMLLGAVLAPTDPIAVTSVLRQTGAPTTLTTVVEAESLFNDGTGVAVYAALVGSLGGGISAGHVTADFLAITASGAAIGVVCGLIGVALLRVQRDAPTDILVTIGIAYGAYLAADLAHASGIVSTVAAGLVIASTARRVVLHDNELTDFWALLAFVLNAILFLLIGTALPTRSLLDVAGMVAATFGIAVAARAVPAYLLLAVSPRGRAMPWRWRHMIFWSGLRGALSVALALSLTGRSGVDQRVPLIAYGVVVLSLVVQGGPIRLVTSRLGLRGR